MEGVEEEYVGSFETTKIINSQIVYEKFDIYVWKNNSGKQEVCVRYGEKTYEYYSFIRIVDVLTSNNVLNGKEITEVLLEKGVIEWYRK